MLETDMDLRLLHRAATAYYVDDLRQAEVAERLGISRPTVSKLLSEARRIGMVRFEVLDPDDVDVRDLAAQVRDVLGVRGVRVAPGDQRERGFRGLGELLGEELSSLGLAEGEAVLLSSGKTIHAVCDAPGLPDLRGAILVPTVGGQQESDPWFQTNELVRRFADRTGATPRFVFAPALPSASLWESLQADPSYRGITEQWDRARVAVTGVGAPYRNRTSLTSVVPRGDSSLARAEGDICLHFLDSAGREVGFPGDDRLVRPSLEQLRRVPTLIALAAGEDKIPSILAACRAGLISTLVTDAETAEGLLDAAL
ncbi:transcriptional regulator [Brachybacterium endophyticum]|uniref:Transcriptional regulator n=1 Tax=Brachybacterium endophyticum TaxID=2182385 RepID=A0A2U2RK41_9MICO|nr:sugar-binding domain-containing protein [Brachybacterium endophyticum]PWH06201.1 transcriptional regulator [Brachybacterium endophyticum]